MPPPEPVAVLTDDGVLLTRHGAALALIAVEHAYQAAAARNGGASPSRDLVTLTGALRQAITQASGPGITSSPPVPSARAGLKAGTGRAMTSTEAAAVLGITAHGARAACRRGTLAADRSTVTGKWLITPAAIVEYDRHYRRQRDGKAEARLDRPGGA